VGLVALGLVGAFVAMRLVLAAHGDVGAFVLRGTASVDSSAHPTPGVPVLPGVGYDGQFYYRMALAPADLALHSHGIVIDDGLRRARIAYPALAYLTGLGQSPAIPYALLLINVLAVGLIGYLGAQLAMAFHRPALYGLLLAGYGGLVTSVARDLTEPMEIALLTASLLLLARRRPWGAAAAMSGAVLTRETALLLPVALAVAAAVQAIRHRKPLSLEDLCWLIPMGVWAGWEGVCKLAWGQFPVSDEARNSGRLFAAFSTAVTRWVQAPDRGRLIFLAEVTSLALIVGMALFTRRRTTPPSTLICLVLAVVLMLSLSRQVWNDDPTESRTFAEVHLLAVAALLSSTSRRALPMAALATAPIWLLTAVLRSYQL
jgi:hypothetical protein